MTPKLKERQIFLSDSHILSIMEKYIDDDESLEQKVKELEEHRVLHNKTMTKFLNKWCNRIKAIESVLIGEFLEYLKRKLNEEDEHGENILNMYYGKKQCDGYRTELNKEIEKWEKRLEE